MGVERPAETPPAIEKYSWRNVVIGAGGFVTGLVFHPTVQGILYAQTDVGGAYRYEAGSDRWIPLNDDIGRSHWQWAGIAGLALDPTDPERVYLAAGSYPQIWGQPGALLRSSDRGVTWTAIPLPFKLPGNADGRGTGDRLLVQPGDPQVLWIGSASDGLWRSPDRGDSWARVNDLPRTGVSVVAAGPNRRLFAALVPGDQPVLWQSTDDGTSWQPVAGQPAGLWLHRAVFNAAGELYLAYGNGPGPNDVTAGEVWRFISDSGEWHNLTPSIEDGRARAEFGFAGLAADLAAPGTLLVASLDRWKDGDELWRTTDGGTTWSSCFSGATWDHQDVGYAERLKPHWIAHVAIDPHSSKRAWFVTGYGLWTTDDIAPADGTRPHWRFANSGLEETVAEELICPPTGAPLSSALGDLGGFRHDDLDSSPTGGSLKPGRGSSSSIDFAGLRPAELVRTHSEATRAARSSDGGRKWTLLENAPAAALEYTPGSLAISADAARLWWLPKGGRLHISSDDGRSWQPSTLELVATTGHLTARIIADREDPQVCYVLNSVNGSFWASTDGGATFTLAQMFAPEGGIPRAEPRHAGHVWVPTNDGLYVSTAAGRGFAKLARVEAAYQVGFGRAPTDGARDTLFLHGRIDGTEGVFRSDDSGVTWLRIDDPAKRYGWIRTVAGDGQVRGRVYLGTSGRGIIVGEPEGN